MKNLFSHFIKMMSAVVNLDECAFLFDEMVFLVGGHLFARLLKTNSK
jgi:hypothetical protein